MREIRIPGLRRVLRASWWPRNVHDDVADEIRFHLDARTQELMQAGLSERDARARAREEYGDVARSQRELARLDRRRIAKAHHRELLMSCLDDLRYAARGLARRPALLVVTTITLSIGIGANTIMFGIVDQLLLRAPAHIASPEAVKRIYYRDMDEGKASINPVTTYSVLTTLRAGASAFSDLAAYSHPSDYSLGRGADARNVAVQLVSGNYFRLLGVPMMIGRGFGDADDRVPDGEPVAIVSYGLWQDQFGGNASAIGRTLSLQGKTFTVVGVAPRGFAGTDRVKTDIWLPISAFAGSVFGDGWHNRPDSWWLQIIGRIRGGASTEVANEQATAAYRTLVRQWNEKFRDSTSSIILSSIIRARTPNGLSRESKVSLWLMGVSGIVLLIACANVGNLLVARAFERRREIAVRLALGVSRGRLARMLLTESALIALLASATAVAIAYGASRLVQNVLLPMIVWNESVVDARVLAFTVGATVVCILLAGIAPAFQGMRTRVSEGLKSSSHQVGAGSGRVRFALLLVQAALTVILLVGAGLSMRSLRHVVTREVGIDRDRVLRVTMPLERFGFDGPQVEDVYRRGMERVRALPGVTHVSVARLTMPNSSAAAMGFEVPGVARVALPGGGPYNAMVTAEFFATVGAAITRGRGFTDAEERGGARVVIVNEAIANAYWPGANPIGHCVKFGRDKECSQVVGVVRNVLLFSLINDDRAIVYAPPNHPGTPGAAPGGMLVRVSRDAASMAEGIRRELQGMSAAMPYVEVKPYTVLVASELQPWRLGATMFTLFGAIALVIAAVGLYSVTAYWVSQRTHEIGVRMALGAQRADVLRLVARQSMGAVVAGLLVGGAAALVASRWISDMLYETSPQEPSVYAIAAVVIVIAGIAASVVPARRSTAIDPARAIRAE